MIYFDNAATTAVDKAVADEMYKCLMECYGNPSSIHQLGRKAKKILNISRTKVAQILNCEDNEVIFTASGSESNNIALSILAECNNAKGNHIITSAIEHPSVYETVKHLESQGFNVTFLPVNPNGVIESEVLMQHISPHTSVVSIMHVNNEVGSIQPIKELANIAHSYGAYFHTDAVQSVGNIGVDFKNLGVDALTFSGHKIYAPKGSGGLLWSNKLPKKPFILGGGQEFGIRSGTENVPSCHAFACALERLYQNFECHTLHLQKLKSHFLNKIKNIPNISVLGNEKESSPSIVNIHIHNLPNTIVLTKLDFKNICVSAGSACSTGNILANKTVLAMTHNEQIAKECIRISFGKYNTIEEVDTLIEALTEICSNQ